MIFYILTAIVFIAELIITFALLFYLFKLSNMFREYTLMIKELNPHIKEMMELCNKISEQILELAPVIVTGIKNAVQKIIIEQIKNLICGFTFWIVKTKVQKHLNN